MNSCFDSIRQIIHRVFVIDQKTSIAKALLHKRVCAITFEYISYTLVDVIFSYANERDETTKDVKARLTKYVNVNSKHFKMKNFENICE